MQYEAHPSAVQKKYIHMDSGRASFCSIEISRKNNFNHHFFLQYKVVFNDETRIPLYVFIQNSFKLESVAGWKKCTAILHLTFACKKAADVGNKPLKCQFSFHAKRFN